MNRWTCGIGLLAWSLAGCTTTAGDECPDDGDTSAEDGGGSDGGGSDGGVGDGGVAGDGGADGGGATGDGGRYGDDGSEAVADYDTRDGFCDPILVYDEAIEGAELLYDGKGEGALFLQTTRVVETAAEWEAVLAATTLERDLTATVDFDTHRVLVAGYWTPGTCGLSLFSAAVIHNNYGGPHLEVSIEDASGGCKETCSEEGGWAYVVAVPREVGDPPTVCRRIEPGCE